MKLIYATDIHGSFERVRELFHLAGADVYIIAGDLVDIPFYTVQKARRYHDLQTYFHALRRRKGNGAMTLEDFVDELLEREDLPEETLAMGKRYRYETLRARDILKKHYRLLDNILAIFGGDKAYCLPGNHDMDLRHTRLRDRDLHLRCHKVAFLRIAGYGGAGGTTPGIPERYGVAYRAGVGIDEAHNEMYRFFRETRPNVIVSHHPAYGIHDFAPPLGETGSPALRRYCERHAVLLCLTGHLHDQWGVVEEDGTVFINPSHFGEVMQPNGVLAEGGYFCEIEIAADGIGAIRQRKLAAGIVHDVVAYKRQNGVWEQEVRDRGRYGALLRGKNYEPAAAEEGGER